MVKRNIASLFLSAVIFAPPAILFPIPTLSFSPPVAVLAVRGGRRLRDANGPVVVGHRRNDRRMMVHDDDGRHDIAPRPRSVVASTAAGMGLALLLSTATLTSTSASSALGGGNAYAYDASSSSDYASETVTNVVRRLGDMAGNVDGTYGILEDISKIITEGKGVGGTLTYDGVKLGDGIAIADEDTTIYNPGLTLLTSTEKSRLVTAIVDNRRIGLSSGQSGWSVANEQAFQYMKSLLDPLHMHELSGYLGILPYYGAILYLVALYVQKNARDVFPLAYGLCALGVFGPVLVLVASGP